MLQFDESKVFADSVDGQLVVLMVETGRYFTFSNTASAVVTDLSSGYSADEIAGTLEQSAGKAFDRAELDQFIADVLRRGILTETEASAVSDAA